MILLDVQIMAMDQTYDFELDEELTAGELAEKIVRIVSEQEKLSFDPNEKRYLYAFDAEQILDERLSLKEQGITGGEKLILI